MGIKHFFHWFSQNYSECVDTLSSTTPLPERGVYIDVLGLDLNGIFHPVAQKIFKYGKYETANRRLLPSKRTCSIQELRLKCFKEICKEIETLVRLVQPKKRLVLCIDGVAPFAKQKQQRDRRFKSALEQQQKRDSGVHVPFDSCEISPGTKFMHYLSKYIDWYIRCQIQSGSWSNLDVIFSSEKVPGEGEHGVMDVFKNHCGREEHMMIYGLDCITHDTPLLVQDIINDICIVTPDELCASWFTSGASEYGASSYAIWSDNGWTMIRAVRRNKTSKRIVRIVTSSSCVDVTEDHRLLLHDGQERMASQCRVGDRLLSGLPKPSCFTRHSSSRCREITFSHESFIMGLWWKNGTITSNEWIVTIPTNDIDLSYLKLYYKNVRIIYSQTETTIVSYDERLMYRYKLTFYQNGTKCIPQFILNNTSSEREKFFQGVVYGQTRITFTTKLESQCFHVLCHSIHVPVSLSVEENAFVFTMDEPHEPDRITDIIDLGTTEHFVYDIETDNHHFHLGIGSVIVHNCDLIMLCLATRLPNIYIYRENVFKPTERYVLQLSKCVSKLEKQLGTPSAIPDFILLCFMVGNDFLPQLPGIEILNNGIEIMFQVYKKTCLPFGLVNTHDYTIRINTLVKFFQELSTFELDALKTKFRHMKKYFPDELMERHFSVSEHTEDVNTREYIVECNFEQYKTDYYTEKINGADRRIVCHEYIRGLHWVIQYYCKGIPTWTWCFPFNYGPFVDDLKECSDYTHTPFIMSGPPNTFEQLLGVLPPQSAGLLPTVLQKVMTSSMSPLISFYPTEFKIDTSGKRAEWEGIAVLPVLHYSQIHNVFLEQEKYISTKEQVFAKRHYPVRYVKNMTPKEWVCFYGNIQHCRVGTILLPGTKQK